MATELGTAYVSIVAETSKLEQGIKTALEGSGQHADLVGKDIGKKISAAASKAMKDGWRPDQDIMAGIPDTKADRIGARIGQVISKGIVGGLRAREAGVQFGHSFAEGAGSVGLGGVIAGWRREFSGNALQNIGMLAGKTLSMGLTVAAGAAVGGIGLALTKGFDRLEKIDSAKAKLKAMKMSAQEVADTVRLVTDSVTGTPFSLDGAFNTATMAIGAGVKDIKRFMTDVTDAAGFAGVDLDRMGVIFTQIQAKGKLTGEEMMQLMEAGLPAKSWIEESYNLTSDQFDKMQQKGQITMEMLQQSIESHAGGMAKNAGETLQGSIANMQTAVARIGADFLSAIFGGPSGDATEGMKDAVNRVTEALNKLDDWVKNHREDIRDFFTSAKDAAGKLVTALGKIIDFLNEIPGGVQGVVIAFAAWEGIKAVATLTTALTGINAALTAMPALAGTAGGSLAALAGPVAALAAAAGGLAWLLHDTPIGNQGTLGNGGGFLPSRKELEDQKLPSVFGGPNASRERRGLAPADPTGGLLSGGGTPMAPTAPTGGGTGRFPQGLPRGAVTPGLPYAAPANMGGNKAAVYKAMVDAGFSPGSFDKLDYIVMHESQYNTTATNPATGDWGIPQFNPAAGNIQRYLGGYNTDAYAQGSAMMRYIKDRYGSIENAYAFKVAHGWYASGGSVSGPGSGKSDSIVARLSSGEHVLTASDVNAMGGQGAVYAFRSALHRAGGGEIPNAAIPWKPGDVTKTGPDAGNIPDVTPGKGYPGAIGVPEWGTPGAKFGPPPPGWWERPINPDDILFPDWMPPGEREEWLNQWGKNRKKIKPFADGGAVGLQKLEDMRTQGAIPAGAGSTAKAGDSAIAKGIGMGGEFINGLIDQAASAASQAASVAATVGTAGGGAAGGPGAAMASQFAISALSNAAKRGVKYGFEMAGIGADAILQQLTPFGMPRWLTQDYSGFMPQWDSKGALGDLMTGGAAGSSVDPNTTEHGLGQGAAPGPSAMGPEPLQPNLFQNNANSFLSTELSAAEAPAPDQQPVFKIDNVYTQNVDEFGRELNKQGRLAAMQYANRPGP